MQSFLYILCNILLYLWLFVQFSITMLMSLYCIEKQNSDRLAVLIKQVTYINFYNM